MIDYLKNEQDKSKHKIAISSIKEIRFVLVNEIVRCESNNSYTLFFLKDGESIVSSTSLYEYEKLLENYGFIRCHQSHLVNKQFVKSLINENGSFLILIDQTKVPISRQKKDFVRETLKKNY